MKAKKAIYIELCHRLQAKIEILEQANEELEQEIEILEQANRDLEQELTELSDHDYHKAEQDRLDASKIMSKGQRSEVEKREFIERIERDRLRILNDLDDH